MKQNKYETIFVIYLYSPYIPYYGSKLNKSGWYMSVFVTAIKYSTSPNSMVRVVKRSRGNQGATSNEQQLVVGVRQIHEVLDG